MTVIDKARSKFVTRQQRRAAERKKKKGKVYPRQTYAQRKASKFDVIKEGMKVLHKPKVDNTDD